MDEDPVRVLSARLLAAGQALLGRSLAVRHVDAGSCGGCELELAAARRLHGGLSACGITLTDDLRAADVLLVTGVVTRNLAEALRRALGGMPPPRFVVAVGDCAHDGGVFRGGEAVLGGAAAVVPVDLLITGCPPSPGQIVAGLAALVEANAAVPRRQRVEPHA